MKKRFLALLAGGLFAIAPASAALAAPNPAGTGQPGAECGEEGSTIEPHGFIATVGFAHAETVYAGSEGTPSAANGGANAVSQYDVACYQLTSNQ
jgi:hypothetical protein